MSESDQNELIFERRGRPRSSEDVRGEIVDVDVANRLVQAEILDESISGLSLNFFGPIKLEIDQFVEVIRGDYRRDAIVRRIWTVEDGRRFVGLIWRASLSVR